MDLLVICHYRLYKDYDASFVHQQVRALVSEGVRVRVLIPTVIGEKDKNGARIFPLLQEKTVDGAELFFFRHPTLSSLGRSGGNAKLAIAALRPFLSRILKDFHPAVIHAHTLGYDSVIGAWLKKKLHCPLVVTTHGSDAALPLEAGKTALLKSWCDAADTVVAVSTALQNKVKKAGSSTPTAVILNGFASHALPKTPPQRLPHRLIQVGHLIPSKRFDVTIRALSILKKEFPDVTLVVIGEGSEKEKLLSLVASLGLSDAVSFLGKLENRRVLEEMSASSAFVMASKPEGFGIVYAEAMSSGCLTVGTEGEGIADLIVPGENGCLVPADDPEAIASVLADAFRDPQKAALMASRGREAALRLTWEANAEKYLALYRKLIGERM